MGRHYAIKHKASGKFFVGFDRDGSDIWTDDAAGAWLRDRVTASAQAALFLVNGIPAQRKVIAL